MEKVIQFNSHSFIIDPDAIISYYGPDGNQINLDTVEKYARMLEFSKPPPINGFPKQIDVSDIGKVLMNGEVITEKLIGTTVWYVTDGHHRSLAAIWTGEELIGEIDEGIMNK